MAKRTYIAGSAIILIIVFALIFLLIGLKSFGITPQITEECAGGTGVLSISNAKITTSTDLNGKNVIRVTAIANKAGECLSIDWGASEIKEELKESTGQDYNVNKGIFGELNLVKQEQIFKISKTNRAIIPKISSSNIGTLNLCTQDTCVSRGYTNTFASLRRGGSLDDPSFACICYYPQNYAEDGRVDEGSQRNTIVDFSITGLGITRLDRNTQSGKISDKAFIKWQYDGLSTNWLGNPNYDGALIYNKADWILVDRGSYDIIFDEYDKLDSEDGLSSCGITKYNGNQDKCVDQYNSLVDSKLQNRLLNYINNNKDLIETAFFNGNQLLTTLSTPITYPVFTIDIDAQAIGIYLVQGKPDVTCPSGTISGNSGQTTNPTFTVKNLANSPAVFGLSLSCVNAFGSITDNRQQFGALEQKNIIGVNTMTVTPTEKEKTSVCTFKAYDINSLEEDSCTYNYKAVAVLGCTPEGSKLCSNNNEKLLTCQKDGSYSEEKCEFGCESFENTYRCKPKGDDDIIGKCEPTLAIGPLVIIPNLELSCLFDVASTFGIIRIIIAILGALISGLIAFGLLRDTLFKKKQETAINAIFSLVIGIIFGILILYLFVIGIIILILMIVIRGVVGSIVRR